LVDNGFGPIQMEYGVAGYSVDLYLPEHHIGIEYDGPLHHLTHQEDAVRCANITKAGLPLLHVTSAEVKVAKSNPKALVKKVAAFVRLRGTQCKG